MRRNDMIICNLEKKLKEVIENILNKYTGYQNFRASVNIVLREIL